MILCVTICDFHVSVTRELFVSDCYQNNKISLYFPLQDFTNKCFFNIRKFISYRAYRLYQKHVVCSFYKHIETSELSFRLFYF